MNSKISILLADDDLEDRYIIADAFKDLGYADMLVFAEDGEKVMHSLNEISEKSNLPSLIVLDLNMPLLNGTETLRLLKKDPRLAHIPVIIFSTSVNNIEREECIGLGAKDYITKPIKYKECIDIAQHFYTLATGTVNIED